ncbi:MAG: preprotein translocase subunit SecE [Elainella sp. Prado103]|nr:preprotein translocase subunit SecE [Elainella sp. Prado103]
MAKKSETDVTSSKEAKDSKEPKKSAESSSGFSPASFLQGTKEELDKVVWPSRQQLISESIAVILMVTLSATTIYLIDNLFGWVAKQVFQ